MSDTERDLAALRAATREAHEAIQDLRAATREARAVLAEIEQAAARTVDERMGEQVQRGLAEYTDAVSRAIDDASQAVYHRFDTMADILLGETDAERRRGKPSIPDLDPRPCPRGRQEEGPVSDLTPETRAKWRAQMEKAHPGNVYAQQMIAALDALEKAAQVNQSNLGPIEGQSRELARAEQRAEAAEAKLARVEQSARAIERLATNLRSFGDARQADAIDAVATDLREALRGDDE